MRMSGGEYSYVLSAAFLPDEADVVEKHTVSPWCSLRDAATSVKINV